MSKSNIFSIVLVALLVAVILGRYLYMQPKFINGEKAQEIEASLISGDAFKLSEQKGKYILIDFWGSWCGPCIAEFPALKALNAKYTGANFEILSIAVEQDEQRWRKAIERFALNWDLHVLDLATSLRFFDSKIAADYGIKEVPTKYLLNPDGQIIGVNLSFEEMDKILSERLK